MEPRISKKRFAHVQGVVAVGQELSRLYGLNQAERFYVGLACWLHDSCKEMKDYELVEKARDLGIELTEIEKSSGHLLHGPVAARLVKKELKISNKAVLAAMSQHTLGATNMTEIAKIVYLADCLEASRPDDFTQPIWAALTGGKGRAQAVKGSIDVDKAMLVACDLSLEHLLKSRRPIHPLTVDVRNHFLGIVRAAEKLAG
ncbi:MAG: putative nicotinate-nucleotide adenylyltransferase [bacterium ADurb.Bin425]|nr:MAG: putative nicotinate-nucleotide adenylyltransferase [bacterium ADurb.Bin425]